MSDGVHHTAPAADGIAIVGMAGRFPGADSLEAFWRNLRAGAETITFFREEELRAAGVASALLVDPQYVKANGVLQGADEFDAAFFGFTPREAETTDPQQRVFLEVAWEALERAGYDPSGAPGRVGVFAGAGLSTYLLKNLAPNRALVESVGELALLLGNNKDFVPTRTSYKLNLRGPSVAVNTACSTSLVAVHLACQSLLDFHCDMVLAGGVSVQVPQVQGYLHHEGGIGSPDGHCRAFDAAARGTVGGNGAGVVVLKRLVDALADGDMIYAVIRGSAVNNDGAEKIGFTAPSVGGQAQVIADALAVADVSPEEISYVEAHGTGTELGDPIEVAALTQVFGARTARRGYCALGSVKTNFGHLDEAAGVAGLVKTVLALEHRELPPSLHFAQPNPKIDFAGGPFFVNARLAPWDSPVGIPRRAGVSSFGIGGTNAHVVLEEAPPLPASTEAGPWQLLVLSARTAAALAQATENLAQRLDGWPELILADVAWTLAVGRHAFEQRRFVIARDGREAAALLRGNRAASDGAPRTLVDLGRAWLAGGAVNWAAHFRGQKRRRMLLPTYPFERKRFWIDAPKAVEPPREAGAAAFHLYDHIAALTTSEARLAQDPALREIASYPAFVRELEAWCGVHVFHYLARGADDATADRHQSREALRERLGVQPAFTKMFDYLLQALAADGYIRFEDSDVVWLKSSAEIPPVSAGRAVLTACYPEFRGIVRLVEHCTSRYPEALSGRVPAITVLYPDGRSDLLESTSAETARHTNKAVYVALLKETIARRLTAAEGRTLRILEVGVGDGLLAGEIAPTLAGCNVAYIATDLSRAFVAKAEKAAAAVGLSFMEFGVLDVAREPETQGFARGSFDLIICLDVVHATARVAETLNNLRSLLAPGGMLGVIEKVRGERWVDLAWGLAEGWWYFTDKELRRHSPLLPATDWERLLRRLPFDDVVVFPRDETARATTDYALLLAQVSPVPIKATAPANESAIDTSNWFYTTAWRRTPAPPSVQRPARWLVLDRDGANRVTSPLAAKLAAAGHDVRRARLAEAEFSAAAPDEIVIVMDGVELFELVQLARALSALNADVRLSFVSSGAWAVEKDDVLQPEQALLVGPLRVIPLELPRVKCRNVDLPLADTGAIDRLVMELTSEAREPVVAWRRGERFIQVLESRPLAEAPERPVGWRERGVYLITGGLGSMGLAFARDLARTVRARLVLIGRSAPSADQKAALADLTALGAEVCYAQADVADVAAMQVVVRDARKRFGAINGVIHTAGVYGQGLMWERSREAMAATLAPKIAGARVLEQVLAGGSLDFFVLCSSLASLAPVPGQIDYCAANAFLDAFAADHAQRTGTRTISIGWGMWQELGMMAHASLPAAQKQAVRDEIAREGWRDAGVAAWRRILAHATGPHVLVSPRPIRLATPLMHPWLGEKRIEAGGRIDYVARLRPSRHWVLDEHRLEGRATLPGTAHLELARAAFTDHTGTETVELKEVYLLSPLVFEDDEEKEVRVVLAGAVFHVVSRVSGECWLEHARGEIHAADDVGASTAWPSVPLETVPLPAGAVRFGPRWQNLQEVVFFDQTGQAVLELASKFHGDLETHALHPALLDMATGFITVRHPLPDSLPFSYRRVVMRRPLPARFRSTVRVAARTDTTLDLDAQLVDESGALLVAIEGYRLRRTPATLPDNARLTVRAPGLIDSLTIVRAARRAPGPDEIEIRVDAAGLNFIEVLYALGMLPASPELEDSFGLECAGRVERAGERSGFNVGDAVIAYANGCFAAFVTAPANAVARRPAGVGPREAATLPAAFATAHHALVTQGRLARGERVLIHAAAGGIGLAAVQIAHRIGAEVFATAGSPEKRDYLQSLGVPHVMDSRSLAFADEVRALTGGRGVDVVLNSLGGEFLARSLELVAPHGRFLELGKRDLFKGGALDLRPFTRIISFIVIDVGPDLPGFAGLWHDVAQRMQAGEYRPLRHQVFALTDARAAFDFMARARHIGKIVLTIDDSAALLRAASSAVPQLSSGRTLSEILGEADTSLASRVAVTSPATSISLAGHERPAVATAFVAPRDATECAIAEIWEDLLGVTPVGVDDDFFELGGDSLLAAQVMGRMHAALQTKLPLSALFETPTAAGLAARAAKARSMQHAVAPVAVVAAPDDEEGTL